MRIDWGTAACEADMLPIELPRPVIFTVKDYLLQVHNILWHAFVQNDTKEILVISQYYMYTALTLLSINVLSNIISF